MSECTIEELLGKSLTELQALSPVELAQLLAPSLAAQDAIFAQLSQRAKSPTLMRASSPRLVSAKDVGPPRTVGLAGYLAQGMNLNQSMLSAMQASGITITKEMLDTLGKQTKTK